MGGVVGAGEAARDQAASSANGAKLLTVADERSAACPSMWAASPPEGWTVRSGEPRTAGEGLARLARSLGGRATPLDVTPGAWRLEVPRERWPELASALRVLGAAEADAAAPPKTAACVEVRVTVVR